jgi:hypothetical protein
MLLAMPLICGLISTVSLADDAPSPDSKTSAATKKRTTPPQELFTGKVVFLQEALKRRGIKAFSEIEKQVALETPGGELIPIVPDWRGRAFFQDKRLRDRKVDLVGFRRKGVPYLQVLMIFAYNEEGVRQYMDYWCDICAIPMYEIKPCDCCQAPIELRFQTRGLPDYLTNKSNDKRRLFKDTVKKPVDTKVFSDQ